MAIDRVKHNLRHSNAFHIKACENFWFYFSGVLVIKLMPLSVFHNQKKFAKSE